MRLQGPRPRPCPAPRCPGTAPGSRAGATTFASEAGVRRPGQAPPFPGRPTDGGRSPRGDGGGISRAFGAPAAAGLDGRGLDTWLDWPDRPSTPDPQGATLPPRPWRVPPRLRTEFVHWALQRAGGGTGRRSRLGLLPSLPRRLPARRRHRDLLRDDAERLKERQVDPRLLSTPPGRLDPVHSRRLPRRPSMVDGAGRTESVGTSLRTEEASDRSRGVTTVTGQSRTGKTVPKLRGPPPSGTRSPESVGEPRPGGEVYHSFPVIQLLLETSLV